MEKGRTNTLANKTVNKITG